MKIKATNAGWKINSSLKKGNHKNVGVSASAKGLNGRAHIGRVSGTFSGTVTQSGGKTSIRGVFIPNNDRYDFNEDSSRDIVGNISTGLGRASGVWYNAFTYGMGSAQDYEIVFEGSAAINQ